MAAKILDGKKVSGELIEAVGRSIDRHIADGGRQPSLAVVLVGQDPASAVYVRNKRKACARAGIRSRDYDLPADVSVEALLELIDELNANDQVDGILVQLPLPDHLEESAITNRIAQAKDVDGFHAANMGSLALRQPGLRPCTPRGVMTLLRYYGIKLRGKHIVIVGASNIVGRPMTLEFLYVGATVTVTHRFTVDLEKHVRQAEILVVAMGKPGILKTEWIPKGTVVVDIGISRLKDGSLSGDVDFDAALERASWITPVPGGVGPMTVATLLQNTTEAAGLEVPFLAER